MYKIKNHKNRWIQGDDKITKAAVRHYKKIFNLEPYIENERPLYCIPNLITVEDNDMLTKLPDEKEIREDVFNMNADSSAGPDGYNGKFFSKCCEIIKVDVSALLWISLKGRISPNTILIHVWLLFLKLNLLVFFLSLDLLV